MYSQYMFNIQSFNPAYTGSWEATGITLLSRLQWMGFENNPRTQTLSFQVPAANNKIGAGFTLLNETIGKQSRKALFLDYSFGIHVNQQTMLRLGITGGATNFTNNLSGMQTIDPDDPSFTPGDVNRWLPNFGVGFFLHSPRFYTGLSVPKLLANETGNFENNFVLNNFTLIGGAVLGLARGIDLKPSFSLRYQNDQPLLADINLSFLIADIFWIGGMVRTSDEIRFGLNTSILIGKIMQIGYAYDFMNYGGLNSYSGATHEVMVSFEFRQREKLRFISPRYF
jgi:type IX secretion system PorP/SprF family membrane protein